MGDDVYGSATAERWQYIETQLEEIRALEFTNTVQYLHEVESLLAGAAGTYIPPLLHIALQSELGNAYRANGQFDQALHQLREVIHEIDDLPESNERTAAQALAHLRTAIVGDITGNLVTGFEHVDRARNAYRKLSDAPGIARCDIVLGALYLSLEDYVASEQAYRNALAYYRQVDETDRIAVTLVNLTTVLLHQHRYEESAAFAREALPLAGNPLVAAAVTGSLANALSELGELDEALELFESTWETLQSLGDPTYQATYKRAVGSILAKRKQFTEALAHLTEALALAEQYDMDGHITASHGLLAEAYGDARQFEQAYEHHREFHRRTLAKKAETAANQLELHKWRMKVAAAEQRAEEFEWSSYRDFLTDLANRRYFDRCLHDFTEEARANGEDFGVLVLDLDRFKRVNDTYGHLLGDEVLRAVAKIMVANVRKTDLAARLGGEEFGVLLSGPLAADHLHAIAEKLRLAVARHDWSSIAEKLKVTVSIGGALYSETRGEPLQMLASADKRLYKAKQAGRNRVVTAL